MKVTKIISIIFAIVIAISLCSCSNESKDNSVSVTTTQTTTVDQYKEVKNKINSTMLLYCNTLKEHNADNFNMCFVKDKRENYSKDDITALFDTVEECKLQKIDFGTLENVGKDKYKVQVYYTIVYSKDYVSVGNRKVGKNNLHERFTFNKSDKDYLISNMEYDW
jgi:lipoprotein